MAGKEITVKNRKIESRLEECNVLVYVISKQKKLINIKTVLEARGEPSPK